MQEDIDGLLAERAVQRVLATCSRRVDRFDGEGGCADGYVRGMRSPDDIVHRIPDRSRG
jgi:hypothetical protein